MKNSQGPPLRDFWFLDGSNKFCSLRIEYRKCWLNVSKRQSGVIPFYEVNFFFFAKRVHSLRNQQTHYVCQKINFIVVESHGYYYFIGRFLIFNFSCLTEPEGVKK
jgi:hypothetical protein